MTSPLLVRALTSQAVSRPPMWFMRQAGRYLPEYRAVRAKFPDFMAFCFSPEAATDVTLQPVERFGLDAAIIFADILTIPHVMGHPVHFTAGEGPRVAPLTTTKQVAAMQDYLADVPGLLAPVGATVASTRKALGPDKAVIGFSGGPFTLACYMLDSKPSQGIPNTLRFMQEHPRSFTRLLDTLTLACVSYLAMQIEAGADAVQIFDSWAAAAPAEHWKTCVLVPLVTLGRLLKERHPETPVILFPRLATKQQLLALRAHAPSAFDAVSLSTETDLVWASKTLQPFHAIQGNLDPRLFTLDSPDAALAATKQALAVAANQPGYVVNLGHGFTPDTKPDTLQLVADTIRAYAND